MEDRFGNEALIVGRQAEDLGLLDGAHDKIVYHK
jgi:hypothetical protein